MKRNWAVVLGAGGHGRVVAAVLKQRGYRAGSWLDDDPKLLESTIDGWKVLGPIDAANLKNLASQEIAEFIIGIGSVDAAGCLLRDKFYQMAISAGMKPLTAISPTAVMLGHVGSGVFVGPGAIVMPGVRIGANAIINTGAIVEHDCWIGWGSHLGSGAILCGGVQVGNLVHVGAGAVVKQGVRIGDGATVGMGAVVLRDVEPGLTVVGNPARVLQCSLRG